MCAHPTAAMVPLSGGQGPGLDGKKRRGAGGGGGRERKREKFIDNQ